MARMFGLRGRLLQLAVLSASVFAFQTALLWMWTGPFAMTAIDDENTGWDALTMRWQDWCGS